MYETDWKLHQKIYGLFKTYLHETKKKKKKSESFFMNQALAKGE